jgi:hypothetical protein
MGTVWLGLGLLLTLVVLALHQGAVRGLPRDERAATLRGPVDGGVRGPAPVKWRHVDTI